MATFKKFEDIPRASRYDLTVDCRLQTPDSRLIYAPELRATWHSSP